MTATNDRTETPASSRFAWLAPVVAICVAFVFGPTLVSEGVSSTRVGASGLLLGLVAGVLWQGLCRKDFVDRFAGWALLPLLGAALALVAPANVSDFSHQGWAAGGVVVGVVMAEWWLRGRAH